MAPHPMDTSSSVPPMSAAGWARWERRVRPAALYGIVCFPFLWLLGVVGNVNGAVSAWMHAPPVWTLVIAWGVTVVVSLIATLPVAILCLANDERMSARRRAAWAVVLFFTTLVGGALFVLSRWVRERKAAEVKG